MFCALSHDTWLGTAIRVPADLPGDRHILFSNGLIFQKKPPEKLIPIHDRKFISAHQFYATLSSDEFNFAHKKSRDSLESLPYSYLYKPNIVPTID